MIQSYSASLNSLGNPRIYGSNTKAASIGNTSVDLLYSRFVIERNTTGIIIYITPETTITVDAANTNTANGVSGSNVYGNILSVTGLVVTFQNNRFEITGDLDTNTDTDWSDTTTSNSLANLVSTLLLKDAVDATIETQYFALSLNHSNFYVEQQSCSNTLKFSYLDANYDFQNPLDNYGLVERGVVDYQYQDSTGSWISMGESKIVAGSPIFTSGVNATALLTYNFCDVLTDTPLRAIRTVRAVPNCGGTSPIIYQSISRYFISVFGSGQQTLVTTIPYVPSATFGGSFITADLKVVCCVSEDSQIEVTPLTLTPNRPDLHNTGIANALKYDLYINNEGTYEEVVIISLKTGTIVVTDDSTAVVGTETNFLTELTVGSKLYTSGDGLIGGTVSGVETTVLSITDNTHLTLSNPALDSYSGTFKSQSNYFINPTTASVFTYNDIIKGTYKLIATYNNACTSVSKEWVISICNATIINTGTCNNPSIQNLSAINYAKFTIKTSNSLDIVDSVSQKVILKDQIVSPLSTFNIPKLDDGFYQLDVQTLDSTGVVIATETQLLFYDCNIKSCEVYLRSNLLGFSNCVDCVDKKANQKEYETLKLKNDMFQIYKDIIYSYWNNIKKQQSIDETWDIEDHLQEVTTYSNALKQIKTICTDCGFSFNTNTGTLSSGDCGCNG